MLDLRSGEVEFCQTKTTNALESVQAIYIYWIRHRGWFLTLGSDHGSAFISECMRLFLMILGVKIHRFSAVGDSRGMAPVENKNKLVREMEKEIAENAAITCWMDMEMFIVKYLTKHNMVRKTGISTVFERCRGEPANTLATILTEESDIDSELEALSEDEAAFLRTLATNVKELMADYKLEQAVRARDNAYTRDTEESKRRTNQEWS